MNQIQCLTPQRVLIAEAVPATRDYMSLILTQCGVPHVDTAASGAEAFSVMANAPGPIDCLVADLTMADGNGLQLLQAVRCGAVRQVRPDMCVVMSAEAFSREDLTLCKSLDVNGVVIKPVTQGTLFKQVMAARARYFALDVPRYRIVALN